MDETQLCTALLSQQERDAAACDLLVTLCTAAALSYRQDTALRPFPPAYAGEESTAAEASSDDRLQGTTSAAAASQSSSLPPADRDIAGLRAALESVPVLPASEEELAALSLRSKALLLWLTAPAGDRVKRVGVKDTVLSSTGQSGGPSGHPTHIFECCYPDDAAKTPKTDADDVTRQTFSLLRRTYGSHLAFHGSALENFHSIIRAGFCGHLNRTSLYGEGTYLATDLGVAFNFSKNGICPRQCRLGSTMTCVAVCEVINHPSVKRGGDEAKDPRTSSLSGRVVIPDKYVVVPNDDHVRLKYIFAYATPPVPLRPRASRGVLPWIRTHLFLSGLVAYLICLLAVGLARTRWAKLLWRKWRQAFED